MDGRVWLIGSTLFLAVACDSAGFEEPRDTGQDTDIVPGTQVGSEGIWEDCSARPVVAEEDIAAFSEAPSLLAARLDGVVVGKIGDAQGGVNGEIAITTANLRLTDGETCPVALLVDATIILSYRPSLEATLEGVLGIRPSLLVDGLVSAAAWEGNVVPKTLDSEGISTRVLFAPDLDVSGATTSGEGPVYFEGCDAMSCTTEEIGVFVSE